MSSDPMPKLGDVLWAKVKGSSPWPAIGVKTVPTIKKPSKKGNWFFVQFFGTRDHAWVDAETHTWPYQQYRIRYGNKDKITSAFRTAVEEADEAVKNVSEDKKPVKRPASNDVDGCESAKKQTATSSPVRMSRLTPRNTQSPGSKVYDFNETDSASTMISDKSSLNGTHLNVGFLGLGIMGTGMVKNLVKHGGHNVTVWNRTKQKCDELTGVTVTETPADVVNKCSVTFCCLSDPFAVKEVVFGKRGVLEAITAGKGFVDMSTIDVDTVKDCEEYIMGQGGSYLEAPVSGSKPQANDGSLLILAAGDKALFDKCRSCFQAMGKKTYFLGETGNGARMKLCVNMTMGTITTAVAEGLSLASNVGINPGDLIDVLSNGACSSPIVNSKSKVSDCVEDYRMSKEGLLICHSAAGSKGLPGVHLFPAMLDGNFAANFPLKHMQKDMRLAIHMGDVCDQPLHVSAAANELFKRAKSQGLGNKDMCAVYRVAK